MPRGSTTLFADIFDISSPEKQRKGRSITLDSQRNECIIDRFWFFGESTGLRYDLLLKIVARQFFLSEITVHNILQQNRPILHDVRKSKPSKKELERKWSHLSWEHPDLKEYL